MSYRTIEEYEREQWLERIRPAIDSVLRMAEDGVRGRFWMADMLPLLHSPLELEDYRMDEPRPRASSFTVKVTFYDLLSSPRPQLLERVCRQVLEQFEADKLWQTAHPRVQLGPVSGNYYEFRVWDERY